MAEREDTPDADLIRHLVEGDKAAFDTLYRRYDANIVRVIEQQLHNVSNREHQAREIADSLWLNLFKRPKYLSRHDPSRRPLSSYLKLLAWRAAQRFLLKLPSREELLGDEDENVADRSDEFERQADLYHEVVQLLPATTLAKALRIARRKKRNTTEQHWLRSLIRRLRKKLNLS